ncbi:MAG: hypothetical protein OCD02_01635 [Spirochaetaceae bacterium]
MKEELFRLEHIDASYSGRIRLKKFSMELYKGEILGVLTHNSREIDSLIEVLSKNDVQSSGRVLFKGKPYKDIGKKVIVIHKKCQLIDNFTVADNIFVIRKGFRKYYINRKKLEFQADIMLKKLGIEIKSNSYIKELTQLEKVLVEILRAYILRIPAVVFKNIYSFLSHEEIDTLYRYLNMFKAVGLTFVILDSTSYIIKRFSSRVIILKNGRNMWTFRDGHFDESIINSFFNLDNNIRKPIISSKNIGNEIIRFDKISNKNLGDLNFSINRGEVLGLVDLEGSATKEIKKILVGESRSYTGNVLFKGRICNRISTRILFKNNIGIIDEDPTKTMLFPDFTAIDNLAFSLSNKVPFFWQRTKYRKHIKSSYSKYFPPGVLDEKVCDLSTNELHSLAYLRLHLYSPDLVILIKPFSSVDRHLENLTISLIELLIKKGIGILILTSNLWELSSVTTKIPINIQRLPPST